MSAIDYIIIASVAALFVLAIIAYKKKPHCSSGCGNCSGACHGCDKSGSARSD